MAEEGIRVKIGADNAELKRKLKESEDAAKEFSNKVKETVHEAKDALKELASENGVGLVTAAFGLSGAIGAVKQFGAAIIDACREGLKELGAFQDAANRFTLETGSAAVGNELAEKLKALAGAGGSPDAMLKGGMDLMNSGINDPKQLVETMKKLRELAVGFGIPIEQIAELFGRMNAMDFTNVERILRGNPALRKVFEAGQEGAPRTVDSSKDLTEADKYGKEAKGYQDRMDAITRSMTKEQREAAVGKHAAAYEAAHQGEHEAIETGKEAPTQLTASERQSILNEIAQIEAKKRLDVSKDALQRPGETGRERVGKREVHFESEADRARFANQQQGDQNASGADDNRIAELKARLVPKVEAQNKVAEDVYNAGLRQAHALDEQERLTEAGTERAVELSAQQKELRDLRNQKAEADEKAREALERAQNEPVETTIQRAKAAKESGTDPGLKDQFLRGVDVYAGEGGKFEHATQQRAETTLPGAMDELTKQLNLLKEAFAGGMQGDLIKLLRAWTEAMPGATSAAEHFGTVVGGVATSLQNLMYTLFPAMKPEADRTKGDKSAAKAEALTGDFISWAAQWLTGGGRAIGGSGTVDYSQGAWFASPESIAAAKAGAARDAGVDSSRLPKPPGEERSTEQLIDKLDRSATHVESANAKLDKVLTVNQ